MEILLGCTSLYYTLCAGSLTPQEGYETIQSMEDTLLSSKLHTLLLTGRKYHFSRGQTVASSDDRWALSMVKSGFIKRYLIREDGSLSTQIIYGPGDIYPLTLVFRLLFNQNLSEASVVYQYEALTKAEIYYMENETFETFVNNVKTDTVLALDLLAVVGTRLQEYVHGLENTSLKSAYERVANQLSFYAQKFGEQTEHGTKILVPLKHQDIADVLNISRETVTISIAQLRNEGLIRADKSIYVPDIKKLEAVAYS